ncbi:hypothetical protein, partial [Sphingomonas bacterium]|uniref:hypothetical protein n=1 Tax=Sphingomonas bacterium TaxID=1895847 RepID=UPI001C2CFD8E
MPRTALLFLAAVIAAIWPHAARASGDYGCTAAWKLRHHDFTGCDNMVMLSPGNDTRVNLVLLAHGGTGRPPPPPRDPSRPEPLFDWSTFQTWRFGTAPGIGDNDHAAGEGS